MHRLAVFIVTLTVAALAYAAAPAPAKFDGGVLVGPNGMTLYTFDKDPTGSGKSVCNDKCAGLWPPLMAAADSQAAGNFSVITRDDGGKQWAWQGKPLYYWIKDGKPGDQTGDNVNSVWHVIKQ